MNHKHKSLTSYTTWLLIAALALPLIGCTHFPRIYKLGIEQGNKLTPESVSQLKTGMSQDEVVALLGTPVLKSVFRKDRWDYVYYNQPGYGKLQKSRVTVFFKDGVVTQIYDKSPCR